MEEFIESEMVLQVLCNTHVLKEQNKEMHFFFSPMKFPCLF